MPHFIIPYLMKKIISILSVITLLSACKEKKSFTLSGHVDGLKKGTLYLQKMKDTLIVNLDSIQINGDANYHLTTNLKEPRLLFLYLDKIDGDKNDDIIDFFAEPGEMTLNTSLDNFELDAKITGSENQIRWEKYQDMLKQFNTNSLELIQENFEAHKNKDSTAIATSRKKYENLLKRKYLYTVNYAIGNKDYAIAPFLALTEIYDANIKYLDTIYSALDKPIKKSIYGKELKKYIKGRKKEEKLADKVIEKRS